MNIKKKFIAFVLGFAMVSSFMPALNVQAETIDSKAIVTQSSDSEISENKQSQLNITNVSANKVESDKQNITSSIGWKKENGNWYYYRSDNTKATGWIRENNKYYYLYSDGIMATGWISLNGVWYYLKDNGAMVTGWVVYKGDSYYLDPNTGAMLTNTTISGYTIGSDGKNTKQIDINNPKLGQMYVVATKFKGIDVSNYDGNIDFTRVRGDGIQCVYMKATQGSDFIDKNLETYYSNAKSAGLKTGFYHYLDGTSSPEEQAVNFYNNIKNKQSDLKPCLDIEATGFDIMDYTLRFVNKFKSLSNMDVCIYTYSNFISNFDNRLSNYSLWEANYNNNPFSLPSNNVWYSRAGHQYSSSGSVSGINGNVDLDEFTQDILR